MQPEKIEKTDWYEDIFKEHPELKQFFSGRGICVTGLPFHGTLEQFLTEIGTDDIDGFIQELNEFVDRGDVRLKS